MRSLVLMGVIVLLIVTWMMLLRMYPPKMFHSTLQLQQALDSAPAVPFDIGDIFDMCLVIYMPSREQHIRRSLSTHGIRATFVPAVTPDQLDGSMIKKEWNTYNEHKVACHISHCKALRHFLESDAETCLIFEDDIREAFVADTNHKRLHLLKEELAEMRWDVIYLGKCWDTCKAARKVSLQLYKSTRPLCRHAYAITRAGATSVLKHTLPMWNNGDNMMRRLNKDGRLNALTLWPPMFFQNRRAHGTMLGNTNPSNRECWDTLQSMSNFGTNPFYRLSVVVSGGGSPPDYSAYKTVDQVVMESHKFQAASKATNQFVLIQDSDVYLSEANMVQLCNLLLVHPFRVHGLLGLNLTGPSPGVIEHDILVSRVVVLRRDLAAQLAKKLHGRETPEQEDVTLSLLAGRPLVYSFVQLPPKELRVDRYLSEYRRATSA